MIGHPKLAQISDNPGSLRFVGFCVPRLVTHESALILDMLGMTALPKQVFPRIPNYVE